MADIKKGNYPANRSAFEISEPKAGTRASNDPGEASFSKTASETIPFGVFVAVDGANVHKFALSDVFVSGIAEIGQKSSDYANDQFLQYDTVPISRRGYFHVKIDPSDPPVVGGPVYVSYATGKEGWLVGSATQAERIETEGINIETVYDNVAEVYLGGFNKYYVEAQEQYYP